MALSQAETEMLARLKWDGYAYFNGALGDRPYQKQIDQFNAVYQNRRSSVAGCNGSGKDFTTGRLVLHWMLSNAPRAKVVVIGPTYRQVNDVVFNELRTALSQRQLVNDWGMNCLPKTSRMDATENSSEHFAVGISTSDPYSLQGYHSPNLLLVVTEAHAVKQTHINAAKRLNPKHILMTGNPFSINGEFYDSHHSLRNLYHTITIAAGETPNLMEAAPYTGWKGLEGMVTKQLVEERLLEWGEDSPMYKASVLGEFSDDLERSLVLLSWAKDAAYRTIEPEGRKILGVDVARKGTNKTVIVLRQGGRARIVWRVQGFDTMETVGKIRSILQEDPEIEFVVVDGIGVGSGVVDRLREAGTYKATLIDFIAGASPSDKTHYANAITEAWWLMRLWFQNGEADIEDDPHLIGQMVTRGYKFHSETRIILQPKDSLLTSPDEADALALTFAPIRVHTPEGARVPAPAKRSKWAA